MTADFWQLLDRPGEQRPSTAEVVWWVVAVVALLVVGAAAIFWIKRWRAGLTPPQLSAEDEITRYRALLTRGDISPEEFERISGVVRRRHASAPPAPPAQDSPPEPPAPSPPGA